VSQRTRSTVITASIPALTSTTRISAARLTRVSVSISCLTAFLFSFLLIPTTDDWSNATQIQFCQLSGLADLKTESDYVRQSLVDHLNDIISLGVKGFRFDAAKHVPETDLANIYSRLTIQPYVISEVRCFCFRFSVTV
jgi:hypothetical protein